ncbi:MAG: lytic transglycosylase domain-containing protein [Anaerococcus prevotii]|uniref:lytic transglycosylase domain-containing protein n=1 Tax=Anaerococcus prevotii TaxID=33034 RepID=UPI002904A34D|nr:lytic transglycosylase domain-containing protein [Anaerococcus prevotii]MDU2558785.1 lytic transglycosylase domain-containing protein [Anaerococcus prevotii]MDU2584535.1 lytic transglycosylase domain-containing protein [Anaerococcus prevotii]MDU3137347.1 lytic transglycosylase domain-containing protein [Anaerococcus prevotii]
MKVIKFIGKFLGFIILAIVLFFAIVYGLIAYQTSRTQISYQDQIYEYSEKYNVDPLLTASIIKVESDFDNNAQSHQGAHGLMQLLEDTAKHSADVVGIDYYPEKLNDVDYNLDLGVGYFDYLYRYYNNRDLALAAYNGGVGNVDSWIKEGTLDKDNPDPLNIPFEETRQYVTKVNANYEVMKKFYKDGLPSEEEISDLRSLSLRNFEIFIKDFIRNIR